MFKSATFKLTMWYLAIVMLISLAFSFAIYQFATNELSFGLHRQTQRIFDQYPVFNNDPSLHVKGDDINQGAHRILLELADFNLLVLIGAGLASYWLARRTLEPIEAAHERQKRFTADVSHELRTPLTSLKMSSEIALMDKRAATSELRLALESNLDDANKMNTLINNLLRLTKLDVDEAQTNFTNVPVASLVSQAIGEMQRVIKSRHIIIHNRVKDGEVFGDNDSLMQLLVILLDNAVKYSPEHATVIIDSHKNDSAIQITITDNGQGITPGDLPYIFDRFYRADAARTKGVSADGYGLGLSIAKLIADRNNSNVTLQSKVGKGTTATVSLPIADTTERPSR